ncbi:hypothetical protein NHX12_006617 [Muraenolepis orangiensis]|uniref:U3 small nucleolar ribonucleoprotein protein MPP10 n=1 Tax=Muraenolepis orangiensis TaxID=630683 RepID=A0A9Q0DV72_9TELE|nr:hypothetical protein NHX12_006617 [Muraenolepis orangiensis]
MAARGKVLGLLGNCIHKLNDNTAHPERFLSLQDGVAADFRLLAKTLYDLNKTHEAADLKGSPLDELLVEGFDEEQIWQELELQNDVRPRRKAAKQQDEDLDEDSDLDFDVDELEKREKQKKKPAAAKRFSEEPSEVDDRFFKLSEMEGFLDDMDKQEGKETEDGINYFQDFPSDNEGETFDLERPISARKQTKKSSLKSSRNLKYKDFFDPVAGEAPGTGDHHGDSMDEMDEEEGQSREGHKKVTFKLAEEEESEGEDMADILGGKSQKSSEKEEPKSSFEKRQEKMAEKIRELETVALSDKPWQLAGEATAQIRPENSILAENVDFDQTSRKAPAITEETTLQLEDIIRQRIKDQVFDDVERKEKPKEEAFQYKKRLTLDHEKSKLSLAQIYEQEFIKQTQQKTEVEENPAHVDIKKMMDALFLKLDALSNFHFTPKPAVPEVRVVSNLPTISMEEVAPVSASDATLLAPEEVKEKNKAGAVLGESERTETDKKRQRRKMKTVKRVKLQEKERRQKLRDASGAQDNRKLSKSQVADKLQKITKGGRATVLKDEGKDKALRSSQAFFSQLQDQVKSQIRDAKGPTANKKKNKDLSASKLKL